MTEITRPTKKKKERKGDVFLIDNYDYSVATTVIILTEIFTATSNY